jgi:2-phospho-L-lactate guanylyltransferase (CobY/MobA/RfbA family)
MPLTFGEPSFSNHVERARSAGIEPLILRLPGLGLDVDGPEDLETLAREGGDCRSARLARSFVAGAPGVWA